MYAVLLVRPCGWFLPEKFRISNLILFFSVFGSCWLKDVRPLLARAHEALLGDSELLGVLRSLRRDGCTTEVEYGESLLKRQANEINFVELGSVWQAPLCEITLNIPKDNNVAENEGFFPFIFWFNLFFWSMLYIFISWQWWLCFLNT